MIRQYVGRSDAPEVQEQIQADAEDRADRAAAAAELLRFKQEYVEFDRRVACWQKQLRMMTHAILLVDGFRRHSRSWRAPKVSQHPDYWDRWYPRPPRLSDENIAVSLEDRAFWRDFYLDERGKLLLTENNRKLFVGLMDLADWQTSSDAPEMHSFKKFCLAHPAFVVSFMGDTGRGAISNFYSMVFPYPSALHAVKMAQADALREEFGWADASPAQRLLIDQIVLAQALVNSIMLDLAERPNHPDLYERIDFLEKRLSAAQGRLLKAVECYARLNEMSEEQQLRQRRDNQRRANEREDRPRRKQPPSMAPVRPAGEGRFGLNGVSRLLPD